MTDDPDDRVSLAQKASLLSRIKDLEFPPDSQLDETLRLRLPSLLSGRRRPTSLDLALVAEATGVTVAYLLSGEEDPAPDDAYEDLVRHLMHAGMSRKWAERHVAEYTRQLARKIRGRKRPQRPACRGTRHCADLGWCHRCDPARAGEDRAARMIESGM